MSNRKKIPERITKAEMRKALKRSGYLIEQRVFPVFEKFGFYLETNPNYMDPITNKGREIDFKALSSTEDNEIQFNFVLLGECINNLYPMVFFSSVILSNFFIQPLVLQYSGLPLEYPKIKCESDSADGKRKLLLSEFLSFKSFHHYFKGHFCTQYCTFKPKKNSENEWMAEHDDNHHEDFVKLMDAVNFEKGGISCYQTKSKTGNIGTKIFSFFYPLLIIKDDLYHCIQPPKEKLYLNKIKHIKFQKTHFLDKFEIPFIIDVIVESHLETYLKLMAHRVRVWVN